MPEPSALDLKLVDRAIERHASASQAFGRDLKIAAALALVFQFGIFFKFVSLSDSDARIAAKLAGVRKAQRSLGEVEAGLGDLAATLATGAKAVADDVGSGHLELRRRIVAFNEAVSRLQQVGGFHAPDDPRVQAQQRAAAATGPLAGLTPDELKVIVGNGDYEKTQALYRALVNRTIIKSVFAGHNARKAELLDRPLDAGADALAALIARDRADLAAFAWTPDDTLKAVADARAAVHRFTIRPPANDDWWSTVPQKMIGFRQIQGDAERVFADVGTNLARPRQSLAEVGRTLADAAAAAGRDKAALDAKRTALDKEYGAVQASLTGLVKPLSALSLDPRDVVQYDPVILAAVVVVFLARFLTLRREATRLAAACRDLGYSDAAVGLYFADPLALLDDATRRPAVRSVLGAAVVAAPGVLAIVSAGRILASSSLRLDAPTSLYAVAALGLLATYAVMAAPMVRPGRGVGGAAA